jgi:hypothetical protein
MKNKDWVEEEFKDFDCGDKRLNRRFIEMTKVMALSPDETINKSMCDFADKKGAYRLFSNNKFTSEDIFKEHRNSTINRISNEKVVLGIHDSSFFSFNSKRSIKGLGNIGGKSGDKDTHGFIGHYSLAVGVNDVPMGIMNLTAWSRAYECPWNNEGERWEEAFEEMEKHCPQNTKFIHLADREADQFELLYSSIEKKRDFIIRSKHDRIIENGDHYLRWHLNKKKINHECQIFHTKLKKVVDAVIKYGEIEFFDTGFKKNGLNSIKRKVKLNIVEIKTTKDIHKDDELHWILLTSLPVENYGDASKIVDYYKKRWHIENFFKVLKDGGCKVERASLRTFEKLEKYICLFSIIAWRLYHIKHMTELNPDEDADVAFTENEILVLKFKNDISNDEKINVRTALRLVAKMGGFNGRKGDGEPGMVSLWRGWVKFNGQVELFTSLKEKNYKF